MSPQIGIGDLHIGLQSIMTKNNVVYHRVGHFSLALNFKY
jgi:hypothetical protein